ncbi:MAG: tRNA adenosine(34) deaminase TadA [Desulfobacterales bacterium]|nr:tRNA adenosine(34) deaminase TadA [Desulfobacterales bacterium]
MNYKNEKKFMKLALEEAEKAGQKNEVPIGSIIVGNDCEILGSAHNCTISLNDPTAHAEIIALRKAADKIGNYRLIDATLYVTIEPCIMCMGAIIHARIKRVVYGAKDLKWGAAGSLYDFSSDERLNHSPEIISGIHEDLCSDIIKNFFKAKRKEQKILKTNA